MRPTALTFVAVLLMISCTPVPPPTGAPPVTAPPPDVEHPTDPTAALVTQTATPPPIMERPLDPSGPWVVFNAYGGPGRQPGLWALNTDGSGLTPLLSDTPVLFLSAAAGTLAYAEGLSSGPIAQIGLRVFPLPGGPPLEASRLMPDGYDTRLLEAFPETYGPAQTAVGYAGNLAWSPDGRQLAFVAMRGESADLFTYAPDGVTRLSGEPGQALRPAWSPDSRLIAYGVASGYAIGLFERLDAVYIAPADASRPARPVLDASPDDDPLTAVGFYGWANEREVLVSDWDACGPTDLRALDVETGEQRPLWEGAFRPEWAVEGEHLLIAAGCPPDPLTLRLLDLTTGSTQDLGPVGSDELRIGAGFTVEAGDRLLRVTPGGEIRELPGLPSPDERYFAQLSEAGLTIEMVQGDRITLTTDPVGPLLWSTPTTLIYASGTALYTASAPSFGPVLLHEPVLVGSLLLTDTP